ncbi:MAG: ISNCY family transposase [Candidatus Aminicenantes bacterium]|nr:ISNCY family transposase [Candidatus Aminicenantes bacterium]
MREELITLTKMEHERLAVIRQVMRRELKQKAAAELLGLSTRQVRNLVRKVERDGAKGLAHGNRGKPSPKRMAQALIDRIIALVKERYRDFKPKFAAEKLWKRDKIKVSDEKMRQIMIGAGLWRVRRHKTEIHPWREPKAYCGEMVQMDGSHHAWLEKRGPKLVLMGMVDDARNRFYGRFYGYEGVFPAMNVLEGYIRRYGLPQSLYVDKHSTYKTVRHPSEDELLRGEEASTQFERATEELGIKIIHAHSPQAKGRIERAFATLQDRLVKELRLASVSTLGDANRFLESYLPRYNAQFEREPREPKDLHRLLPKTIKLGEIFCLKTVRTILDGYIIRWKGKRFVIEEPTRRMLGRPATVMLPFDGRMVIRYEGRDLGYREIPERPKRIPAVPVVRPKPPKYIPPPTHPWKVYRDRFASELPERP